MIRPLSAQERWLLRLVSLVCMLPTVYGLFVLASGQDLPIFLMPLAVVGAVCSFWISPGAFYARRGMRFTRQGQHSRAIRYHTAAIQSRPMMTVAYINRAVSRLEMNDFAGALTDLDTAIRRQPKNVTAHLVRGISQARAGNYEEAIQAFGHVIERQPKNAYAFNLRGAAYSQTDKSAEALANLDVAAELQPDFAEVYANRGPVHYRMGDKNQALDDLNTAIRLNPKLAEAYNNRGEYHFLERHFEEALNDFQQAHQLRDELDQPLAGLAVTWYALENVAAAKQAWRQLVERDAQFQNAKWAVEKLGFGDAQAEIVRQLANGH